MTMEKIIRDLKGGAVAAEYGPMRLIISACVGRVPQRVLCCRAAEESFKYLERLARYRKLMKAKFSEIPHGIEDGLAVEMIRNVLAIGDKDLTPMAAVAGTIADAVADFLADNGMTKVVVDNGGDVAVRLQDAASVTIGIRSSVEAHEISRIIRLDSNSHSWGVTTSGLGGRSLTRGVASAATVIARNASLADAAATTIANASFIEDKNVCQVPAETIDPETDIAGTPVTVKVGPLSGKAKARALSSAMSRAQALVEKGVIFGALVVVQGKNAMTDFFRTVMDG